MLRSLISCCLILGLVLTAVPAQAAGRLQGEGFRINVPRGFERLERGSGGTELSNQLQLGSGLSLKGQPTVHVYYAGMASRPDAILVAARLELADGSRLRSRLDLQRYVMDNLRISAEEFDALVAAGGVTLTPTQVGDYDALQMAHDGSRGALGLLNEPATRTLTVLGGEFVLVLVLMVVDDAGVPVESTWQQIKRSLDMDSRGAYVQQFLVYGAAGLAALIVLVFTLRMRAQRRRRLAVPRGRPIGGGWEEFSLPPPEPGAEDLELSGPELHPAGGPPRPSISRPADGLGTTVPIQDSEMSLEDTATLHSSLDAHRRENPEAPVAPPPPVWNDEQLPPRQPTGLKSGLDKHRAENPDAPTAPTAPVWDQDEEVPPPEPDTGPNYVEDNHPVPTSELERGLHKKAPPVKRKGLHRTLPKDGKFSE